MAAADSQGMREPLDHLNSPGFFITPDHNPVNNYKNINLNDSVYPAAVSNALIALNDLKPEHREAVIAQATYALPPKNAQNVACRLVSHAYLHEETIEGRSDQAGALEISIKVKKLDKNELKQAQYVAAVMNATVQNNEQAAQAPALAHTQAPPKGCCVIS